MSGDVREWIKCVPHRMQLTTSRSASETFSRARFTDFKSPRSIGSTRSLPSAAWQCQETRRRGEKVKQSIRGGQERSGRMLPPLFPDLRVSLADSGHLREQSSRPEASLPIPPWMDPPSLQEAEWEGLRAAADGLGAGGTSPEHSWHLCTPSTDLHPAQGGVLRVRVPNHDCFLSEGQ